MSPSSSDRRLSASWTPSDREIERARARRSIHQRGVVLSTVVTVVVLALLVVGVTSAPGWDRFREYFLSWPDAKAAFPDIAKGFWINVKMFLVAEPLILLLGGLVAITRGSVSPWLTPARFLAVIYTDLFRGVPTILVVYVLALGIPTLQLQGMTTSLFWLGTIALVLSYGAYVAEVIRSGIESIHPSQVASAEALGLSRTQTMRFVVLPQGVRRVVPPLLNDFVSLQKDTALVGTVAVFESLYVAADYGNYNFNFTPFFVTAAFFVALTVPLARITDWLGRRAMERERGSR